MVVISQDGRDAGKGAGIGGSEQKVRDLDAPGQSAEERAQIIQSQRETLLDRVSEQAQTELDRFNKTITNPSVSLLDTIVATYRDQVLARNVFHDLRLADNMLQVAKESREAVLAIPSARHVSKVAHQLAGVLGEFIRTFPTLVTRQNIVRKVESVWRGEFAEGISVITDEMRSLEVRLRPFCDAVAKGRHKDFPSAAAHFGDVQSSINEIMDESHQLQLAFRRDTAFSRQDSRVDRNVEQEVVDRIMKLPEKFGDVIRVIEKVRPALLTAVYNDALEQLQSELLEEESSDHEGSPPEASESAPKAISTTESAVFRYVLNAAQGRHSDAIDNLRSIGAIVTPLMIKDTIGNLVEEGLLSQDEAQALKPQVRPDLVKARQLLAHDSGLPVGFPLQDPEDLELVRVALEGRGFSRSQVENLAPKLGLEQADRLDKAIGNLEGRFADIVPVVAEFVIVTDPHILTKDENGIEQRLLKACELWRKAIKAGIDPSTTSGVPDLVHRLETYS